MIQALALGLIGAGLGKRAYDEYEDYQMQSELGDLTDRKLERLPEETTTVPLAEGLTPPTAVGKYKYGNRTFDFVPPSEYLSAIDAMDLAAVHAKYSRDPEKAMELRTKAQDQLAKSFESMGRKAIASKSPEAMVQAYTLAPNGYSARLEKGENGNLRVLHYPDGRPDQAREVFSGTADALLEWGANNISPELMNAMAKESLDLRFKEAQITNWEANRDINRDARQQQADYRQQTQLLQQANYWTEVANKATSEGEYVQAMQKRDVAMRALAGIESGGLSGGGAPTVGSPQKGAIHPAAIYDYLVNKHGVAPDEAVGIVTNIGAESTFNPAAPHDYKNGAPTGYGLFGHRDPDGKQGRRAKLFQHAGNPNPSWTQQIDYAMTEPEMQEYLSKDYGGDYRQATKDFVRIFEKPKYEAEAMANRAKESATYAGLTGRAESPALIALRNGAPQQGLTATPNTPAQPTSGGIDYGAQFRARQAANNMPKPGKEMSAKDRLEAIAAARDLLGADPNFTKLSTQDQLRKAEQYAFGVSGAGWDAVGSMGQLANGQAPGATGTPEGNGGGLTGQDFSAFATATAAAAREEESKAASAKDQARFDQMVSTWAAGYKQQWFRDMKTSNPAYALDEARKAIAQIETLYPSLSAEGKKSAELALRGFWKTFPELMPKAAN